MQKASAENIFFGYCAARRRRAAPMMLLHEPEAEPARPRKEDGGGEGRGDRLTKIVSTPGTLAEYI